MEREFSENSPLAAPDFVTVARAEAQAANGSPWPISGDLTTLVQNINYIGRVRNDNNV